MAANRGESAPNGGGGCHPQTAIHPITSMSTKASGHAQKILDYQLSDTTRCGLRNHMRPKPGSGVQPAAKGGDLDLHFPGLSIQNTAARVGFAWLVFERVRAGAEVSEPHFEEFDLANEFGFVRHRGKRSIPRVFERAMFFAREFIEMGLVIGRGPEKAQKLRDRFAHLRNVFDRCDIKIGNGSSQPMPT